MNEDCVVVAVIVAYISIVIAVAVAAVAVFVILHVFCSCRCRCGQDIIGTCSKQDFVFWCPNVLVQRGAVDFSEQFEPAIVLSTVAYYAWNADIADFDGDGLQVRGRVAECTPYFSWSESDNGARLIVVSAGRCRAVVGGRARRNSTYTSPLVS